VGALAREASVKMGPKIGPLFSLSPARSPQFQRIIRVETAQFRDGFFNFPHSRRHFLPRIFAMDAFRSGR
jgi:hypothetical protein